MCLELDLSKCNDMVKCIYVAKSHYGDIGKIEVT